MGATLKLNQDRARRELARFTRGLAPAMVDKVVRKTTFDVGGDIVRSLNGGEAGYPVPKRIDTGRYRAAWSMGVRAATGKAPGPTSGGDADNPQQADDGTASERKGALSETIRVTNNVEYGPHIEEGTETMAPGNHVALAMLRAAARMREALGEAVPQAWEDSMREGF